MGWSIWPWGYLCRFRNLFVANDAQDQEYLELPDRVRYYPRRNKKIGDMRDNVTIGKGNPWGGLGIRVEARGFNGITPKPETQSSGNIPLPIFLIMTCVMLLLGIGWIILLVEMVMMIWDTLTQK